MLIPFRIIQILNINLVSFYENRLEIAKELLADEGVLLVSISEDGQAYLKVLMDDIFSAK